MTLHGSFQKRTRENAGTLNIKQLLKKKKSKSLPKYLYSPVFGGDWADS